MEDRGFLVVGTNWKWEVLICMGNVSRSIPEAIKHEVVVQLRGPGYCYYRRFSPIEGDALQFYIKPIRPVSPDVRNEGRSSPMSIKEDYCNMPILTRSTPWEFGMGWSRTGTPIEEENRSCDSISSVSNDVCERELLDIYEEFIN